VCHEEPLPPSEKDPRQRWQRYDPLISIALAKSPQNRFHNAAAFREAVLSAFAKPVSETISEETIIAARVPVPPRGAIGGTTVALGSAIPGRTAANGAAASTAPTNPSNPPSSLAPPTGWDPTVLAQLETELASHIGVVARAMVRKFARQTNDVSRLIELLAAELDAKDRQAFLAATPARAMAGMASTAGSRGGTAAAGPRTATHATHATRATGPTAAPGSLGGGTLQALTPEHVEKAAALLGAQMGPIAKVLAKRAAAQARDRTTFHAQLAAHIEDMDERARFLRAVAKL
ncbi:MAG TPA: hypothetical protein VFR86_06315, partial [Burkholderiaceae bacterium]|nr:hypothetical protein [Burkholderiaceae bacterium]